MKNPTKNMWAVITTYSFDTSAQLRMFSTEKEALEFLEKGFLEEKQIDEVENEWDIVCKHDDDYHFASSTIHFDDHDVVIQWNVTATTLPAPEEDKGGINAQIDALPEEILWGAYNKATVILAKQSIYERFDSMRDSGILPSDASLSEDEATDLAQDLLYADQCYPSMYDQAEAVLCTHFGVNNAKAEETQEEIDAQVDALSPKALAAAHKKEELLIRARDIGRYFEELKEFDEDLEDKELSMEDLVEIAKDYDDGYDEDAELTRRLTCETQYHELIKKWFE